MTPDYSKRLTMVSLHSLSSAKCDEIFNSSNVVSTCTAAVFNSGTEFATRVEFDPKRVPLTSLIAQNAGHVHFIVLQVDFLKPQYDYVQIAYPNACLTWASQIEYIVFDTLRLLGVTDRFFTVNCTTAHDAPVSALRRHIVFPGKDLEGNQENDWDDVHAALIDKLDDLSNDLEEAVLGRIKSLHLDNL